MRKCVVASVLVGTLLGALEVFFVWPNQRILKIRAIEDVTLSNTKQGGEIVATLKAGEERTVVRCEDNKSTIEPVIRTIGGTEVYPSRGNYKVVEERESVFSMPRFLNCGNR
jgi:hypothetical protein